MEGQWFDTTVHPDLLQCPCLFTEPQITPDDCAISMCEYVCELGECGSSVKRFEWSIRLEKCYISAVHSIPCGCSFFKYWTKGFFLVQQRSHD